MQKYAEYIKRIEIDSLWSGKKHIVWELKPQVNILSGINGQGKSTIINKVVKGLSQGGEFPSHMLKGVRLDVEPADAKWIRYDMIRSLDSSLTQVFAEERQRAGEQSSGIDGALRQVFPVIQGGGGSLLDIQLYNLQRKYLDYQVNIGNRIIAELQQGNTDAAQQLSQKKTRFQDIVDDLFHETGKKIMRTENEIRFTQIGEVLGPYQLSSGEKQMLVILLTVLVEDDQPYVLFMDEPEVSLHIEWQKRLIDLCLELNPHVQIILTTHSPAVIMNGWLDAVTEVSDITV
jgi:predicted ATP-binding protein involved in virulence